MKTILIIAGVWLIVTMPILIGYAARRRKEHKAAMRRYEAMKQRFDLRVEEDYHERSLRVVGHSRELDLGHSYDRLKAMMVGSILN